MFETCVCVLKPRVLSLTPFDYHMQMEFGAKAVAIVGLDRRAPVSHGTLAWYLKARKSHFGSAAAVRLATTCLLDPNWRRGAAHALSMT